MRIDWTDQIAQVVTLFVNVSRPGDSETCNFI